MTLVINELNNNLDTYKLKIRYSTLSDYFDHLNSLGLKFPTKKGLDFEYGWPHVINLTDPVPNVTI